MLFRSKESQIPVIVVSAKDELDTKIDLLSCGADDYLTKPFEIKELIVRIAVLLRRTENQSVHNEESTDRLVHKELEICKETYEVKIKGNSISLTRQEFSILELLITHPNKVFSKQEIYEYAWDEYYVGEDKTINVHISNIRSKIKKISTDEYIETVWGIGFKLAK